MQQDWTTVIGLGVAGNMTGHLEQAGEADTFAGVRVSEAHAPKGIFPFYVPGEAGQLGVYPVSADTIRRPADDAALRAEPEVALLCDLTYGENQMVMAVQPRAFTAFNDCSLQHPATLISAKKNWGAASKGLGDTWLAIDDLHDMDDFRLMSFVERDGMRHALGEDSAVKDYSYFHEKLLDWLRHKMNIQQAEPPFEHIAGLLAQAGYPSQAVISIGATRYTSFGEGHRLLAGDVLSVIVYRAGVDVEAVLAGDHLAGDAALLRQVVI